MFTFRSFLRRHSLVIGILLMFLVTWTIDLSNSRVLPFQVPFPIAIMLGWGFVVVSLLMTWVTLGSDAAVALVRRYLLWRVGLRWYFVAFLLLPAIFAFAVLLNALLTGRLPDFSAALAAVLFGAPANVWLLTVPFFLFDFLTNGEEMGWRGYVLPRLQARHSALAASLILGVLWGAWHLPKYLAPESSGSIALGMVKILAEAILYTWLYNNTRGSLLLTSIMHAAGNTAGVFLPVAGAASGDNMSTLVIVVAFEIFVAAVVTILAGPARLSRTQEKQVQSSEEPADEHSSLQSPFSATARPSMEHDDSPLALKR